MDGQVKVKVDLDTSEADKKVKSLKKEIEDIQKEAQQTDVDDGSEEMPSPEIDTSSAEKGVQSFFEKINDGWIKVVDSVSGFIADSLGVTTDELAQAMSEKAPIFFEVLKSSLENTALGYIGKFATVGMLLAKGILKGVGAGLKLTGKLMNPFVNGIKKVGSIASKGFKAVGSAVGGIVGKLAGGVTKMLKYSVGLLGISSGFIMLKKATSEYINSNEQLSNQLSSITTVIGNTLGPVIAKVVGWVSTAISYVNALIKAFTGVDLIANSNAKAIDKQASATNDLADATEKANRQTASFDEMNTLSASGSSGSSGGAGASGVFDTSAIDTSKLDEIKAKLDKLLEPIKNAWSKYGQPLIDSMKTAFTNIWELIKSIGKSFEEVWTNGTGERTVGLILQIFKDIFDIIGNIAERFKEAWESDDTGTQIVQALADGWNNILETIELVLKKIAEWSEKTGFFEGFLDVVKELSEAFEMVTGYIKDIVGALLDGDFSKAGEKIGELAKNIFDTLTNWITNIDWKEVGSKIATKIINGIKAIKDLIKNIDWKGLGTSIINFIKSALGGLASMFSGVFGTAWKKVKEVFSKSKVAEFFRGVKDKIKEVFSKIPEWFKTTFSNAWTKVKNVFSTGGKIFNGIKNGILSGLKTVINGLISGINKVIKVPFDGLNTALSKIKNISIVGKKPFDFIQLLNVPQIPKLARGGIVSSPTFAQIGEAGPEAIVPLQNNTEWLDKIADRLVEKLQMNNNGNQTIVLQVGSKTLYRWILNEQNKNKIVLNGV